MPRHIDVNDLVMLFRSCFKWSILIGMKKDFDILIIGGGVVGAACALEASLNNLKVLLVDKSDFASSTSAASFKIVHGGLRYIQHLDYTRLKESYREQQFLRKAAPHLVRPLPFLVPCYGIGMKGRLALRAACSLYEYLARTRNDGVRPECSLPDHEVLSKDEVLRIAPHLYRKDLKGGVVFYDAQMLSPDRLSLSFILEAERRGAVVKNYNEVVSLSAESTLSGMFSISEVKIKDTLSGFTYAVSPKVVINAAGPYVKNVASLVERSAQNSLPREDQYLSKGIQVIVPQVIEKYALSVESRGKDSSSRLTRGGRAYFLQPWRGHTIIGTTDSIYKGDPSAFRITLTEIREFLSEVHEAYPSDLLKPMHVQYAYGGLRPIDPSLEPSIKDGVSRDGMNNTSRREDFVDHANVQEYGLLKIDNLISIAGIKYTTCRAVAEKTIGMLDQRECRGRRFSIKKGLSRDVLFYDPSEHRDKKSLSDMVSVAGISISEHQIDHLLQLYGSQSAFLLKQAIGKVASFRIEPRKALLFSQIEHAIRFEYARTLSDIISRRLELSGLGFVGHQMVEEISSYAQVFFGWDEAQKKVEIDRYLKDFMFDPE